MEQQQIRAAVLHEVRTPIRVEEVLLDPPQADEVLIRVAAAGVCHSDLHVAEGHLGESRVPTVLGHEGAGLVEAVGDNVSRVSPGDAVSLCFLPACRACRTCKSGRPNLCEAGSSASFKGTMLDGTSRLHLEDGTELQHFLSVACFAERCVVPEAAVVQLPRELPLWQAALIGCAVVTGLGAVRNAAEVARDESVCVVGCGGVGLQVIAGARLAGADPIIAVDRVPEKLERALEKGANHAVDASSERPDRQVRRLTDGGAEKSFEVVGKPETIRLAWDVLRPGGTAVVVGLTPIGVDANVPAIDFLSEKTLRGCFYGSGDPAAEIAEIAALVTSGTLEIADVVSHFAELEDLGAAFDRMRGGVGARTIVVLDRELAAAPDSR